MGPQCMGTSILSRLRNPGCMHGGAWLIGFMQVDYSCMLHMRMISQVLMLGKTIQILNDSFQHGPCMDFAKGIMECLPSIHGSAGRLHVRDMVGNFSIQKPTEANDKVRSPPLQTKANRSKRRLATIKRLAKQPSEQCLETSPLSPWRPKRPNEPNIVYCMQFFSQLWLTGSCIYRALINLCWLLKQQRIL